MNCWLDTTALVELNFRQERHAEAVRQALPEGAEVGVSAYVLFELARGYLTKLRELLDLTFVCEFPDELREKVESKRMGERRLTDSWTDVLNDDFCRVRKMKGADQKKWRALSVPHFRMRLRTLILDGWDGCTHWKRNADAEPEPLPVWNGCGCRVNLPPPRRDGERLAHDLPDAQCGQPGNCGVLAFVRLNAEALERVRASDGKSKAKAKKGERDRRMEGLGHLLAAEGEPFEGRHCHGCGDAMIALEAIAEGGQAVTKDKEYPRLCKALGGKRPVMVAHRA